MPFVVFFREWPIDMSLARSCQAIGITHYMAAGFISISGDRRLRLAYGDVYIETRDCSTIDPGSGLAMLVLYQA